MAKPVWTAERTGRALVKSLLPVRSRLAHKGDFGKVLLLCGSKGLAGAAVRASGGGPAALSASAGGTLAGRCVARLGGPDHNLSGARPQNALLWLAN